jgi:serine/threonine protein kinase
VKPPNTKEFDSPKFSRGTIFGEYELLGLLERGRTSAIYIARTHHEVPQLSRPSSLQAHQESEGTEMVAIKILLPEFSRNQEVLALFQQEMALAKLPDHPNVVKTIKGSTCKSSAWGDVYYIVMELLSGESLKKTLERNPISLQRALDLLIQLCQAVSHLHEHGIVHGDIKPENVLITAQGQLKLIDFGIAEWAANSSGKHRPTTLKGTPLYMSPELLTSSSRPTAQSDIYAIGIVAYELLMSKITHGKVLLSLLPQGFQAILAKALQPNPDDRYRTVRDLMEALANYIRTDTFKRDKHGTDYYVELYDQLELARQALFDVVFFTPLRASNLTYGFTVSSGIGFQGIFLGMREFSSNAREQGTQQYAFCFSIMKDSGLKGVLESYQAYEHWRMAQYLSSKTVLLYPYSNVSHENPLLPQYKTTCFIYPKKDHLKNGSKEEVVHIERFEWGHLFGQTSMVVQNLTAQTEISTKSFDRLIYIGLMLIPFQEFPSTPQAPFEILIQEAIYKTRDLSPQRQTEALLQHIRLLGGGILERSPIVILSLPLL